VHVDDSTTAAGHNVLLHGLRHDRATGGVPARMIAACPSRPARVAPAIPRSCAPIRALGLGAGRGGQESGGSDPCARPDGRAGIMAHVLPSQVYGRSWAICSPRKSSAMSSLIVIAEDDDDIRAILTEVLEGEGYRVLDAPDGAAALDLVKRERTRSTADR